MRFRLLAFSAIITAAALAACGSSGTSTIPSGGGGSTIAPPTPTGSASQQIPANAASATTITSGGLSITIPADTFSTATTVTAYQYATASSLPVAAQSKNSRVSAQSRVRALSVMPAGATFLAGFAIDSQGIQPFQAIGVTETFSATVPAGDVIRVAKLGASGAYSDVDTATVSGTSVTNNKNVQYVSVSTGGTAEPYIFYAIRAASAAAPAAISITVTLQTATLPLVQGGTTNYYASGSDANGNYLPFTATFAASPSTLGSAAQTAFPNVGAVTATALTGAITITATDPRTSTVGTVQGNVLTQRPGTVGDALSYSGTLTRTDVYTYPAGNPLPTTVQNATITQNISVVNTPNPLPSQSGTIQASVTSESDVYETQTSTTTTTAVYSPLPLTTVPSAVQLVGFSTTDEAGNVYSEVYTDPQTVDQLPEVPNASWQNSPAGTYQYNGSDYETIQQVTAADGSYSASQGFLVALPTPTPPAAPSPQIQLDWQTNPDGSGSYAGSYVALAYYVSYAYSAPSNGQITIEPNFYYLYAPSPPPTPGPAIVVSAWYPAGSPLYSDSNIDKGQEPIPTTSTNGFQPCQVPAAFAGAANELQELTTSIDPVIGTLTTVTTNQYVVAGFGPVCVQVQSETKEFYDYNLDDGDGDVFPPYATFAGGASPLQDTKISETLDISTASGGDIAASAAARKASLMLHPVSEEAIRSARIQIESINARDRLTRIKSLKSNITRVAAARRKGVL